MRQGFSLVEILIAITILSVVLVASTQAIASGIRNITVQEHKIYATYFAEEMVNWLDVERDADWKTFTDKAIAPSTTYCVNTNLNNSLVNPSTITNTLVTAGGCAASNFGIAGSPATVPHIFQREVVLTPVGNPPTRVNVVVTVEWDELQRHYSIPIRTSFTIHE